jgi:hypothetical protein
MGATAARVKFRDSGGEATHSDLANVAPADLATGRPWRTFRWHRGQAHFSGWYWAATMRQHVVYESRFELARLMLADFDPRIVSIAAQPFCLTASVKGKERTHVPDFLLLDGDGAVSVVNVKPEHRLADPKVADSLGWAGAVFAERGWQHEIWSGAPAVQLSNVRMLAAYRDLARVDMTLVAELADALVRPVSLGEVERAWPSRDGLTRAAALHLVWRGLLRMDLSVPLSSETMPERAA